LVKKKLTVEEGACHGGTRTPRNKKTEKKKISQRPQREHGGDKTKLRSELTGTRGFRICPGGYLNRGGREEVN